jgi:phosphate:Na+ symporter
MGQNIGTCVTALISSIGVSKHAKRVSVVHIYFNLIGTAVWLSGYLILDAILKFGFTDSAIDPAGIAIVHSIFNVATTVLLFPFSKLIEKLAVKTVKDKTNKNKGVFLDERLLATPGLAVAQCREYTSQMARLAAEMLMQSVALIDNFSQKTADKLIEDEQKLDDYEDKLGTFLVKLSGNQLSDEDSHMVSTLLHTIGDFERIGDHAKNFAEIGVELIEKELELSQSAKEEISYMSSKISRMFELALEVFEAHTKAELTVVASRLAELSTIEAETDKLKKDYIANHFARLAEGKCVASHSPYYVSIVTRLERVGDHLVNVGYSIVNPTGSQA